jgi:hypothetical protein
MTLRFEGDQIPSLLPNVGGAMDAKLMDTQSFTGPGYQPVIDFGAWRVATLNYIDEIHPAQITFMERHNETDEVFVLQHGQAVLFIGEGTNGVEAVHAQVLEPEKMYNVKQAVWHTIVLSRDGSVLIVENRNTTRENSDYFDLSREQRELILETAKRVQPGCW